MDYNRSIRMPIQIFIDHNTPIVEVDVSGCSAPPITAGATSGPPPTASSERPQAIYSVVDVPISTSKAVRIGCWSTSPIDSDAFKGKIYPNFLEKRWWPSASGPSQRPVGEINVNVSGGCSPTSSSNIVLPRRISPNFSMIGPTEGKIGVKNGSDDIIFVDEDEDPFPYDPSQEECPPSGSLYMTDLDRRSCIVDALEDLKLHERIFKSQYCYGPGKAYVNVLVPAFSPWKFFILAEEPSGIHWFGVYGIDEICVVTLNGHLDRKRVRGCLAPQDPELVLSIFRRCVLSELEDLADPSSKRREELGMIFDTPFFVASLAEDNIINVVDSHENPSAEAKWLLDQELILLRRAKDSCDVIKLAIFGFQQLIRKKCDAEEIGVTVMFGRNFGTGYTRDLEISEIGDYLSAVEALRTI